MQKNYTIKKIFYRYPAFGALWKCVQNSGSEYDFQYAGTISA